jgi:hypothetical protein
LWNVPPGDGRVGLDSDGRNEMTPEYEFKIVLFTNGNVGIHCFRCGNVSFNPKDVREKYCGFCCKFHDEEKELVDPR